MHCWPCAGAGVLQARLTLQAAAACSPPCRPAGIAIRGGAGCAGAACVMQGNHILGRAIDGCAAPGLSAAVAWFGGSPPPAWDANQVCVLPAGLPACFGRRVC